MFYSIEDLVAQAKEYPSVSELMIATEMITYIQATF